MLSRHSSVRGDLQSKIETHEIVVQDRTKSPMRQHRATGSTASERKVLTPKEDLTSKKAAKTYKKFMQSSSCWSKDVIQKEIAKTYSALKSTTATPSLPTTNRRKKSKRQKKLLIRPFSSLN